MEKEEVKKKEKRKIKVIYQKLQLKSNMLFLADQV